MGCFDTIFVPCPKCGEKYPAQSKGGDCCLRGFELNEAPQDVLDDVNRHAPFICEKCQTVFSVDFVIEKRVVEVDFLVPKVVKEA